MISYFYISQFTIEYNFTGMLKINCIDKTIKWCNTLFKHLCIYVCAYHVYISQNQRNLASQKRYSITAACQRLKYYCSNNILDLHINKSCQTIT